jgi:hypothetical protein
MFSGHNYIEYAASANNDKNLKVFSTTQQAFLPEKFTIATAQEIEEAATKADLTFEIRKKLHPGRAVFLETMTECITVRAAALESNTTKESFGQRVMIVVMQLKIKSSFDS